MAVLRERYWALLAEWERHIFGYGEADWAAVRLINRRIRNVKRDMRRLR